jgi:hypothetical protein
VKLLIRRGLSHRELSQQVSKRIRDQLPPNSGTHSFTHLRSPLSHGVIRSPAVEKALEDLGPVTSDVLAAEADGFTTEARELLRTRHARVLTTSEFTWTDASLEEIKVFVGTKVNGPSHR